MFASCVHSVQFLVFSIEVIVLLRLCSKFLFILICEFIVLQGVCYATCKGAEGQTLLWQPGSFQETGRDNPWRESWQSLLLASPTKTFFWPTLHLPAFKDKPHWQEFWRNEHPQRGNHPPVSSTLHCDGASALS